VSGSPGAPQQVMLNEAGVPNDKDSARKAGSLAFQVPAAHKRPKPIDDIGALVFDFAHQRPGQAIWQVAQHLKQGIHLGPYVFGPFCRIAPRA